MEGRPCGGAFSLVKQHKSETVSRAMWTNAERELEVKSRLTALIFAILLCCNWASLSSDTGAKTSLPVALLPNGGGARGWTYFSTDWWTFLISLAYKQGAALSYPPANQHPPQILDVNKDQTINTTIHTRQ